MDGEQNKLEGDVKGERLQNNKQVDRQCTHAFPPPDKFGKEFQKTVKLVASHC